MRTYAYTVFLCCNLVSSLLYFLKFGAIWNTLVLLSHTLICNFDKIKVNHRCTNLLQKRASRYKLIVNECEPIKRVHCNKYCVVAFLWFGCCRDSLFVAVRCHLFPFGDSSITKICPTYVVFEKRYK